jgi:hypothetical protein
MQPIRLYSSKQIPTGFRYPESFVRFVELNTPPEIYPWWFIDAASEAGELAHSVFMTFDGSPIPFAKDDSSNKTACFDGCDKSGSPKVVMYDLEDPSSNYLIDNFDAWLHIATETARSWQR